MSDSPVTPLAIPLQYASSSDANLRRRGERIALAVAAIPAAASCLLSFTNDISPLSVFGEVFRRWDPLGADVLVFLALATPFLLGGVLVLWQSRQIVDWPIRPWEWLVVLPMAVVSGLITAMLCALFICKANGIETFDRAMIMIPPLIIGIGAAMAIRSYRRKEKVAAALIFSGAAYSANAFLCLWAFHEDHDVGWYVTLVASVLLVVEIIYLSVRPSATAS